jgi:hypothetical protein
VLVKQVIGSAVIMCGVCLITFSGLLVVMLVGVVLCSIVRSRCARSSRRSKRNSPIRKRYFNQLSNDTRRKNDKRSRNGRAGGQAKKDRARIELFAHNVRTDLADVRSKCDALQIINACVRSEIVSRSFLFIQHRCVLGRLCACYCCCYCCCCCCAQW